MGKLTSLSNLVSKTNKILKDEGLNLREKLSSLSMLPEIIWATKTRHFKIEVNFHPNCITVRTFECTPKGGFKIRKQYFFGAYQISTMQNFPISLYPKQLPKIIKNLKRLPIQNKETIKKNKTPSKAKWKLLKELPVVHTSSKFHVYRIVPYIYGKGSTSKDLQDPDNNEIMIKTQTWACDLEYGESIYWARLRADIENKKVYDNDEEIVFNNHDEYFELISKALLKNI